MLVIIASRRPAPAVCMPIRTHSKLSFPAFCTCSSRPPTWCLPKRSPRWQCPSSFPILLTRAHIKQLVCIRRLSKSKQPEKMFSSSKITALCLAVVALSNGAYAEKEAAQTFGLLGAGLHGGAGLYGAGAAGLHGGAGVPAMAEWAGLYGRGAGYGGVGAGLFGRGTGYGGVNAGVGAGTGGAGIAMGTVVLGWVVTVRTAGCGVVTAGVGGGVNGNAGVGVGGSAGVGAGVAALLEWVVPRALAERQVLELALVLEELRTVE
ncbi:hypothetical protein GQ600_16038 [Phytophthora cactorum]|nr:hypothetical protein GQ600_16038 [Phytophthora cactorum]